MAELVLSLNGKRFGGWTEIHLRRSIETVAASFNLQVSDRDRPVLPGEACVVSIDDVPVLTGHVDDVNVQYGSGEHRIAVSGRCKTGDLVDCAAIHRTGNWTNQTLTRIARDVCAPFGITVSAETNVGAAFNSATLNEGGTVLELLQGLARQRGVLLVSDAAGNLVITRAGTQRLATALVLGENILEAAGSFSWRDRFSEYIVKGETAGTDTTTPEDHSARKARVTDDKAPRYRPTIVLAEEGGNQASFTDRATWERNVHAGQSTRISYVVQGWHHAAGLWWPNHLVRVRDPLLHIDEDLLIVGVELMLNDRDGLRAALELAPRAAYDLIALPAPETQLW